MSYHRIEPAMGARYSGHVVRVGLNRNKAGRTLSFLIGDEILAEHEWTSAARLALELGALADRGTIRLSKPDDVDRTNAFKLARPPRVAYCRIAISATRLEALGYQLPAESQLAKKTTHHSIDGALVIRLPSWIQPPEPVDPVRALTGQRRTAEA